MIEPAEGSQKSAEMLQTFVLWFNECRLSMHRVDLNDFTDLSAVAQTP